MLVPQMELTELTDLEKKILLELYGYEMDSGGQVIPSEDLLKACDSDESEIRLAFRKLALKGLLLGQSLTVRGKLFVEESGLLPSHRWVEVQALRESMAVAIVEAMVTEGVNESINLNDIQPKLPIKPGILEFNLDVMAERGFLTILRGNRVGLGPRLRVLIGK